MPENTNRQQPQQTTQPEEAISETAKFYRDFLISLLGYGVAGILLVGGWMMGTGETEHFSFEDPNEVAVKAATKAGAKGSQVYEEKFEQTYTAAEMRRDRAIGFLAISIFGWTMWTVSVFKVLKKCEQFNHPTITKRGAVYWYVFPILIAQIIMYILVFKD